jgi:hypothetical protein
MENVPFWRIGRSLQSKSPSLHPAFLGKDGELRPLSFFRRITFLVHDACRTLVFLLVAASRSIFATPAITLPLRGFCTPGTYLEEIMSSLALLTYTALLRMSLSTPQPVSYLFSCRKTSRTTVYPGLALLCLS